MKSGVLREPDSRVHTVRTALACCRVKRNFYIYLSFFVYIYLFHEKQYSTAIGKNSGTGRQGYQFSQPPYKTGK